MLPNAWRERNSQNKVAAHRCRTPKKLQLVRIVAERPAEAPPGQGVAGAAVTLTGRKPN